jgi:chaperone BCS1
VEYKLATKQQASALFSRFYPVKHVTPESLACSSDEKSVTEEQKITALEALNRKFTAGIPEHDFSTAELEGYLLGCKMMPEKAAYGVQEWVDDERRQREEKRQRIEAKKRKQLEKIEKMEADKLQSTLARIGGGVGFGQTHINGVGEKKPSEISPPPTMEKQLNGSRFVTPPTVAAQVNSAKLSSVNDDSTNTHVNGVEAGTEKVAQDA